MHQAKPLFAKVVMGLLTAILSCVCFLGNGFVLVVIARFKSLRTVPNILVANLAFVDLFNAVITLPPYMIYYVFEASWFKGKALGIMTVVLNRLFTVLNLASMIVVLTNTYLAISFDLKYFVWKTNRKALLCVFLTWLISIVLVAFSSFPLFGFNLGDVHVMEYREEIFKEAKLFVMSFMGIFLICAAFVCFLTAHAIKKQQKKRAYLNLPPLQAEARLQCDIRATKTIVITVAAYFLCYVPSIVYAVVGSRELKQVNSWFAFTASSSLYISSALNPIIYYLRTKRFRLAFKQFRKDPFGSSDFDGEPNSRIRRELKGKPRKLDGKIVEGVDAHQIKHSNQRWQTCSGKQRNGRRIDPIERLEADPYACHEVGDGKQYEERKEQSGDAHLSSLQARNLCQGQIDESDKENENKSNSCGLYNKSRKRHSFSYKERILPMEVSRISEAGDAYEEKPYVNVRRFERETESQDSKEKGTNRMVTIEELIREVEEAEQEAISEKNEIEV